MITDARDGAETALCGIKVRVARSLRSRLKGLIGEPPPPPGEGLLIMGCNAIHTFFMRYPIDALFLDSSGAPVKRIRGIKPWRPLVWGGFGARAVIEIASEGGGK